MASGPAAGGGASSTAPADAVTVRSDVREHETVFGVRLPGGRIVEPVDATFSDAPGPLGQPAPPPAVIAGGPQVAAVPEGGQP